MEGLRGGRFEVGSLRVEVGERMLEVRGCWRSEVGTGERTLEVRGRRGSGSGRGNQSSEVEV
jgi:hypothetical protein